MARIIKCVCHGTTFARLKKIAESEKLLSIEELQRRATFAENCRRCVPYVSLMLKTGKTEFDLLDEEPVETAPTASTITAGEAVLFGDEDEL